MIDYKFERAGSLPGALANLWDILTMLRGPQGCPWDRKQTARKTVDNLLGEVYEYLDALNGDDASEQKEEIGDVLMNVLMILEIHSQDGDFDAADAVNDICEKLYRRHPHVFTSSVQAKDASEVRQIWDKVKQDVEGRRASNDLFSSIPQALPRLEAAYKIQKTLEGLGFDWPDAEGVCAKVQEELGEVRAASTREEREEEIGDLLFSVINLARFLKVHPETALHRTCEKVRRRFNHLAEICQERGIELKAENADAMNEVWEKVKAEERG